MVNFDSVPKEFAKQELADERKEVIQEVVQIRTEHFEKQKNLKENLSNLAFEIRYKKEDIDIAERELAIIAADVEKLTEKTFSAVMNFLEVLRLKESMGVTKRNVEQYRKELLDVQATHDAMLERINERSALDRASKLLEDWYATHPEKHQIHQEKKELERRSSIEGVMAEHDVIIIHGIRPDKTPGANSIIKTGVSFETKLDITLGLEPPLSTSSIQDGDGRDRRFGGVPVGIILAGGRVEGAAAGDAGTTAVNLKEREFLRGNGVPIPDQIADAVHKRPESGLHNELVVGQPKAAGIFIAIDSTPENPNARERSFASDMFGPEEIARVQEYYPNMPLYALCNGKVFRAVIDQEKKMISATEAVTKEELIANAPVITAEQKKYAVDRVFEQDVFSPRECADMKNFESRALGQEQYLTMTAGRFAYEPLPETEKSYYERECVQVVAHIDHVEANGGVDIMLGESGETYVRRIVLDYTGRKFFQYKKTSEVNELRGGRMNLASGTLELDVAPGTLGLTAYLMGMQTEIRKKERVLENQSLPLEQRTNLQKQLQDIAFHLRGFGEAAEKRNDPENAKAAYAIASRVVDDTAYRAFCDSRVKNDGSFKVMQEDLE